MPISKGNVDPETLERIIARAWTDREYRATLPQELQDQFMPHPAGETELSDDALDSVAGGAAEAPTNYVLTMGCCGGITTDREQCWSWTTLCSTQEIQ